MNFSLFFRGQSKGKCKEDTLCMEKVRMILTFSAVLRPCGFCNTFSPEIISAEIPGRAIVSSKDIAANCVQRALRRRVMVSSARQAVSGLLASGGAVAAQYLGKKMAKAWQSRTA